MIPESVNHREDFRPAAHPRSFITRINTMHKHNLSRLLPRLCLLALFFIPPVHAADTAPAPASPAVPEAGKKTPVPADIPLPAGRPDESARVRVLLVPAEEAMISSRFFGTIDKLHVKESDRFKAGDPLVTFDCSELNALRGVARSEVKLQRTSSHASAELHAEKIVGNLDRDLSAIKAEEAAAKLAEVETRIEKCRILAPFPGQVAELKVKSHETLQPGSPIMLIQNPQTLEAHVHVPSKWLEWLKPGAALRVFIEETGKSYPAKVRTVAARVDEVSRSVKVFAQLTETPKELLSGMSGYAEFDGKK